MSTNTSIEWATKSWSPIIGCDRVSSGCDRCYAINTAHIRSHHPNPKIANAFAGTAERRDGRIDWTGKVNLLPERLTDPLKWRKPERIFVNSQSDLFHDQVPDEYIAKVWQMMGCAPQHTYQILTKRHARMRSWVTRWYAGEIAEPYEVRDVPGYPGYRISTAGVVFGKRSDTVDGLSFDIGEQGHRRVTMHREGSPRSGDRELVHRLVLTTFVRPGRAGEQACHRNGDPSDNRLSNLYWGSQSDNWRDRIGHGNGRSWSKLTDVDVAAIRRRDEEGESAYRIAQDYPVSDTQIRNVLRGDQWATPTDVQRIEPPARALLSCVWVGVSTENQQWADIRIPALLDTPAAVRFISAEPLLGPIDLLGDAENPGPAIVRTGVRTRPNTVDGPAEYDYDDQVGLDWVIVGGESGRGARPMHPWWAESLQQQCETADVPYLFKQWGEWTPLAPLVDGKFDFSGGIVMTDDGITYNHGDLYYPDGPRRGEAYRRDFPHHHPTSMYRLGKKRAGRELYHDGRTWDQYPAVAS